MTTLREAASELLKAFDECAGYEYVRTIEREFNALRAALAESAALAGLRRILDPRGHWPNCSMEELASLRFQQANMNKLAEAFEKGEPAAPQAAGAWGWLMESEEEPWDVVCFMDADLSASMEKSGVKVTPLYRAPPAGGAELQRAVVRLSQEVVRVRHNHDGTTCVLVPEALLQRVLCACPGAEVGDARRVKGEASALDVECRKEPDQTTKGNP